MQSSHSSLLPRRLTSSHDRPSWRGARPVPLPGERRTLLAPDSLPADDSVAWHHHKRSPLVASHRLVWLSLRICCSFPSTLVAEYTSCQLPASAFKSSGLHLAVRSPARSPLTSSRYHHSTTFQLSSKRHPRAVPHVVLLTSLHASE